MKIFIGCSASNAIVKKYFEACTLLLDKLFIQDNTLVFGASESGLMGLSYQTAKKYGRKIMALAPEVYHKDIDKLDCDVKIITKNISQRTDLLIENADVILFLPGGIGTVYEIWAALESKRSNEFNKPIIIYNALGYFDNVLTMLNKIYAECFAPDDVKKSYIVFNEITEVLNYFQKLS